MILGEFSLGFVVLFIMVGDWKFVFYSGLLHGLMIFGLCWTWSSTPTPFGAHRLGAATIEFTIPRSSDAVSLKKSVRLSSDDSLLPMPSKLKTEKSLAVEKSDQQQLGFAEGTRSLAQIGQANGTANTDKERYIYELRVLIEQKKSIQKFRNACVKRAV